MRRLAVVMVVSMVALGLGLGACGSVVASAFGGTAGPGTTGGAPGASSSTAEGPAVPASWEALDRGAAGTCPGLGWSVLAAIGRVETDSGRSRLPGVASGSNAFGAEVIYRWDGGLWHQRDEAIDGRGSLVSEGSLPRGQGGGHSGLIGSPTHDDQISSVASGVAI